MEFARVERVKNRVGFRSEVPCEQDMQQFD